jgi:ADP-ribosylation factor GTPase-activating protein 2/3
MSDYATKEEAALVFSKLKQNPANQVCFDCPNKNPTWTLIPFGVLLCLECLAVHRNLGVHISFVKLSNLDSWQRIQLRHFKFGGNHVAKEFYQKNGGLQFLSKNGLVDIKLKYTAPVATKYKERLKRKAQEDAAKHADVVTVADSTDDLSLSEGAAGAELTDDFFLNWTKPVNLTPSPLLLQAGTPSASTDDLLSKAPAQRAPATRTTRAAKPAAKSILASKGPRNPRLAARRIKVEEDIDFDEIERRAQQEAAEARKLGYTPQRDTPVEAKPEKPELGERLSALSLGRDDLPAAPVKLAKPAQEKPQTFQKLGFGMVNGANVTASETKKNIAEVKYTGEVSNKYGTQKGILLDEFFGRGPRFDETAQREARSKLQLFEGAQLISSSSYFGEDDAAKAAAGGRGSDLSDLEAMARDYAGRFSGNVNQDLDVLKDALEDGAKKLDSYLRDFLR